MKKKHWPAQLHILLASGIFLAALIFLYLIVGRHNRRIDLTRGKIYSLSEETLQVLKRIDTGEVKVHAFFAEEDPARGDYKILMKELATHPPHVQYEFLDPDRSPSEARRYGVDTYRTIVIQYQNHQERIKDLTEQGFTNALIRLAHPKKQTLCFTKGHGENNLGDKERSGLAGLKQLLGDHHYEVKETEILKEGVPEDCNAVVMAGPRYELLPRELETL